MPARDELGRREGGTSSRGGPPPGAAVPGLEYGPDRTEVEADVLMPGR